VRPKIWQRILRLDNRSTIHKRKIDKLDFIEIKNVCSATESAKGEEKTSYRWGENACKPHLTKDSYQEYIKKYQNLTLKKSINPIRKWAKDVKRYFANGK